MIGTNAGDTLVGTGGIHRFVGDACLFAGPCPTWRGAGTDTITAGGGMDDVHGGFGADTIEGVVRSGGCGRYRHRSTFGCRRSAAGMVGVHPGGGQVGSETSGSAR